MNTANKQLREIASSAWWLGLFVLIAVAFLSGIHALTHERIARESKRAERAIFDVLLAPESYDNDLLQDTISVTASQLSPTKPIAVHRAYQQKKSVAVIYELISDDGYSGEIKLLLAVNPMHQILATRVIEHHETPGLGDDIEAEKSNWILQFNGKNIQQSRLEHWRVQKDGGSIAEFAGATITPRAVVGAIRQALEFDLLHQTEILNAKPNSELFFTNRENASK